MKFARYELNGKTAYGAVENGFIRPLEGDVFGVFKLSAESLRLAEVRLLAPCMPSKVVAVGLNYVKHIKEFGDRDIPRDPVLFLKMPHTIVGPEDYIKIPEGATRVDYEAELAVVIKKTCRNVRQEEADGYILGATCLNDVTERNIQRVDGQWTRGKNFETFCPVGPFIVDGLDYNNLGIKLALNGEIKQNSCTSNFLFNVQKLVSFISGFMPLYPGDIVTTGTPDGVSPMKDGDVVEITIEGVGTLRNFVKG